MSAVDVDFNAPDLAARIETLSQHDLDNLPFGVILLDRLGTVLFYSKTEAGLSGYGMTALGKNFFEVSRNPLIGDLRARIMSAMEAGVVDLELGWRGGLGEHERELRIRVQSSRRGGIWMFVERD
jgi:photoactive yellow protein